MISAERSGFALELRCGEIRCEAKETGGTLPASFFILCAVQTNPHSIFALRSLRKVESTENLIVLDTPKDGFHLHRTSGLRAAALWHRWVGS